MYAVKLLVIPTSQLTVKIPPAIPGLYRTYPFIPPTTFSGYLARLYEIKSGKEPSVKDTKEPLLIENMLNVFSLGLYPSKWSINFTWRQGFRLASGYEQKPDKAYKFIRFTRKRVEGVDYWLIEWESLLCDKLEGYVVSEHEESLDELKELKGYGYKLGYEGFAYIEEVSDPLKLEPKVSEAVPSTIVIATTLIPFNREASIFHVYKYVKQTPPEFKHALAIWTREQLKLEYYVHHEAGIYIPKSTLKFFKD